MTHTRLLAILLVLLGAFTALGTPSLEPPRPGEALYLVVLGERPIEPDIAALGGRLIRSWGDRRLVAIPMDRMADLQSQPTVSYIQRVWTGEQKTTQRRTIRSETATPMSRVPASARISADTAPPQWTTGVYQYDGSGSIKSMGGDSGESYEYDHVGRLTYSDVKGEQKTYKFDPYGNLLQLGTQIVSVNQANNRLTTATDPLGTIAYDAVGNRHTDAKGRKYLFDPLGMVMAIDLLPTDHGDLRMIYSADDQRIVVSEGATAEGTSNLRFRVRDFNNKVLREWKSTADGVPEWERDYIYAEGTLVAGEIQVDQSRNGMRHYHLDHLGSIRLVTDGARALVAEHNYEPFGAELGSTIAEHQNTGIAPRDPLKFTGHERDYFTGANMPAKDNTGHLDYVDYMHARYYTPMMGRFLSADPGKDWDMSQPQSWNMYAYTRNNPVNRTDPTGKYVWSKGVSYTAAFGKYFSSGIAVNLDHHGTMSLTVSSSVGGGTPNLGVQYNESFSRADNVQKVTGPSKVTGAQVRGWQSLVAEKSL